MINTKAHFGEFRSAAQKGAITQKTFTRLYQLCRSLDSAYVAEVIVPYCLPFMTETYSLEIKSAEVNPFAIFATQVKLTKMSAEDFQIVCQTKRLQGAKDLTLDLPATQESVLSILASSKAFPQVQTLTLSKCHESNAAWQTFVNSQWATQLSYLHLVDINKALEADLDLIITSSQFEQLTLLNCNLGPMTFLDDLSDLMLDKVTNYY